MRCRLFPMIKRTVTKVNCFAFFGEELGTTTLGMSDTARLIVLQRRIPSSPRLPWNSRRGLS